MPGRLEELINRRTVIFNQRMGLQSRVDKLSAKIDALDEAILAEAAANRIGVD